MKISIITTTYNRKDYLEKTLESIEKSVLAPLQNVEWEHIVYDDASEDGTGDLFKNRNGRWRNVLYFRGEENKGPSFGKNYAISKSKGDYIFCIDSDDIILQRTLYNFSKIAIQNAEISWFVSDFLRSDDDLKYQIGNDYFHWDFSSPEEMLSAIWKGEHFLQGNVFFKKTLFEKVGGFDENIKMAEDLDLYIRFLLAGEMPGFSSFISHFHRYHEDNLSLGITLKDHKKTVEELRKKYEK